MCGRTACTRAPGEIADACVYQTKNKRKQKPTWKDDGQYSGSYNKGPKSFSPILLNNCAIGENKGTSERVLLPMQWGLIPSWHKGNPKDFSFNMINCRVDSITEKKSFSNALTKGRRCVVLADGFYEWHVTGKNKQPYYIELKDTVNPHDVVYDGDDDNGLQPSQKPLLTMAGLFDIQWSEEKGELYTYTIITVDASNSMKWLHHRMPAILDSPQKIEKWLDSDSVTTEEALKLLVPTDCLNWHPVSSVVNNVRNNTSDCIKKIDLEKETSRKFGSGKLMSQWLQKSEKRQPEEALTESAKKKSRT